MPISLKKHLQSLTHNELEEEMQKLAKRFREVTTHFEMELGNTTQQTAIVESVKQKIKKQFFSHGATAIPKPLKSRN